MDTYQDFLETGEDEGKRQSFVRKVINVYKSSSDFRRADVAERYARHENVTINNYQKFIYTAIGEKVPDIISANWKMANGFFPRFVKQELQHLLGNSPTWENEKTGKALGENFDNKLLEAARKARVQGVGYGFWNRDRLEVFGRTEFIPLFDEENGALRAGVRFWQIDDSKPLRATLYEEDGYTHYIWRGKRDQGISDTIFRPKRPYILKTEGTIADGERIYDGMNYPTFPIVPLWANSDHTIPFDGLREQIDCYDLVKAGFANQIDNTSEVYWILQNAGGMDDPSLVRFRDSLKTIGAAYVDDGVSAEARTIDVPYAARDALLNRIQRDLYRDAMAFDPDLVVSGAATATQIKAAYELLNSKTDDFEYCVDNFIYGVQDVAGIERDHPTFQRSMTINTAETIQQAVQAAPYLSAEFVTKKILNAFGDGDQVQDVLDKMRADEAEKMASMMTMQAAQQGG